MPLSRRTALLGALTVPALAPIARAQDSGAIAIGALTPQTGAGGPYGPGMVKTIRAVVDEVNAAGGIGGRKIELSVEDTETNPDSAVRAARKLIDVNKVAAITGTWASAVTTAVAPLCWESERMLFTVSGADSITKLPHKGYIIRTQPNTYLQGYRLAQYMLGDHVKRVFVLSAQTPFAVDSYNRIAEVLKAGGAEAIGDAIYDAQKTTFRTEIDQALKAKPDALVLNGYLPDVTIIMRELYRAGYDGKKYTFAYAAGQKLLDSVPADVVEGLVTFAPSPNVGSPAYKRVTEILGAEPDPYAAQTYDHMSLIALSIAKAGAATGPAIHDNVRAVGNPAGETVSSAVEGMRALAAGKQINYEGASGPCHFNASGDIENCKFRFEVADKGKYRLLSIS